MGYLKRQSEPTTHTKLRIMAAMLSLLAMAVVLFSDGAPVQAQANRTLSNLQVTSAAPGQITISWDAPQEAPTTYRVMWAKNDLDYLSYTESDETHRGNKYTGGTTTSITLSGLENGATYKVQARARYDDGSGPWSAEATGRVQEPPANKNGGRPVLRNPTPPVISPPVIITDQDRPQAPSAVSAIASHNAVSVHWFESKGATSYNINVVTGGIDTRLASGVTEFHYLHEHLTPNTTYIYKVWAVNSAGTSAESTRTTVTTLSTPAPPPPIPILSNTQSRLKRNAVLVANENQADHTEVVMGPGGGSDYEYAQAFTTGPYSSGYGLYSIVLPLKKNDPASLVLPGMSLAIHSDGGGSPGRRLFSFARPQNIQDIDGTRRDFTFYPPRGIKLSPNTTYWLVLYASQTGVKLQTTESDDEDFTSAAGWSIANTLSKRTIGSGGQWEEGEFSLQFHVHGPTFFPTRNEDALWELPDYFDTYGVLDTEEESGGFLTRESDSGRFGTDGDRFALDLTYWRTYRISAEMDGSGEGRGGGIEIVKDGASWDHHRDDGRLWFDFTVTKQHHTYYVNVQPADGLNRRDAMEYYGTYTLKATDITDMKAQVGNLDVDTTTKTATVGTGSATGNHWMASSFTTGSNTDGYQLGWVDVKLSNHSSKPNSKRVPKAALYTDSSGSPGTKVLDFDAPSTINDVPSAQYYDRFFAPETSVAALTASTTYWVVFKNDADNRYTIPVPDSTDIDSTTTGWTMGGTIKAYDETESTPAWTESQASANLQFEVWAEKK